LVRKPKKVNHCRSDYAEVFAIEGFAFAPAAAAARASASRVNRVNKGICSRRSATRADTDVSHLAAKTRARW